MNHSLINQNQLQKFQIEVCDNPYDKWGMHMNDPCTKLNSQFIPGECQNDCKDVIHISLSRVHVGHSKTFHCKYRKKITRSALLKYIILQSSPGNR
jgi:hypothetical protein